VNVLFCSWEQNWLKYRMNQMLPAKTGNSSGTYARGSALHDRPALPIQGAKSPLTDYHSPFAKIVAVCVENIA